MSDWIEWNGGGACAMGSATMLTEVKLANGDVKIGRAEQHWCRKVRASA